MKKIKKQEKNNSKKTLNDKSINSKNGITLIALVITIVVLLILASVSIAMLTGDNGILLQAQKAKGETEIASEKEAITRAIMGLIKEDGKIRFEDKELQNQMDKEIGQGKTEITDVGGEYEVLFKESNRYYTVDENGNIIDIQEIVKDKNPGNITIGRNGEKLDGSAEHPYEIWNIEDLIVLSNMTNGEGVKIEKGNIVEITDANNFSGKYIEIKRNLNFKSKLSYDNSQRTDFGDINDNPEDNNILINEMLTGNGFLPIGKDDKKSFNGNFEGNNFEIKNIHMIRIGDIGLFGVINNGFIRNLGINGDIYGRIDETIQHGVGGVVGASSGKKNVIENCWNKSAVKGKLLRAYSGIGGIVGHCKGATDIINCYNEGKIIAEEDVGDAQGCGGIVGYIRGHDADVNIFNCYNIGIIESNEISAGIIGGIWAEGSVNVENTFNAGYSNKGISGNAGRYNNANSKNCYYLDDMEELVMKAEAISKEKLYSEEFVNILNDYIDKENKIGWEKWKIGKNGYPIFQ